jgi:hypothetical protein
MEDWGFPKGSKDQHHRLSRLCRTSGLIIAGCSTIPGGLVTRSVRCSWGLMATNAAIAVGVLPRRRMGWFGTAAIALAAVAVSLATAAWITGSDLSALASVEPTGNTDRISSFEDRFFPASMLASPADSAGLRPLDRSTLAALEMKFRGEGVMTPRPMPPDFRAGFVEAGVDEAKPMASTVVPLPRSRPPAADLEARGPAPVLAQADSAARPNDRTLMQKLSDLGRVTLASLAPDGGLFRRRGPDLASLGYDGLNAVYDITAHAVYLPNGVILEAHSGMGSLRDDPEHVSISNIGATPPADYELKPREKMFHGVQALRMTPAEGSDISGRSGLLVHSYMLGLNGDSNGCVSIRDYDRFLKAFNDGEINRIVVVPSLSGATLASQRPTSQS